jgi:hypothetical protein
VLDRFEYVFYSVGVPAPEAVWTLAAKLRGTARQCARRRPLTPTDGAVARTVLIHAAAGETNLLARGAGGAPESSESELDESCHLASRLLIKAESNQRLLQLRRGEGPEQASYEILAPMGSPSLASHADSGASAVSPDGVSAFIARVLDQLALSAWLPAAFLTAGAAVLLEFRSAKSANILNAVGKLTAHPVQVLVIMIPLLVIATVVTQAFSFEAIRTLEGYWRRRGLASLASMLMIRRHVRRKKAIIERRRRESTKALRAAIPDMVLSGDVPVPVVRALEAHLSGRESEAPALEGKELQVFVSTIQTWRNRADAWRLARVDRLITEENSYPVDSRILPTKLGNLIRATEDELRYAGGDVRSFVLRQRDTVSRRVQMQHDQFRTRLDMYCTLVFVSVFLSVMTPVALVGRIGIAAVAITIGSFAAMGVASYLAAIASAGGYCTALKQMDEASRVP